MINHFTQGLLTGLGIGLVCLIWQAANHSLERDRKVLKIPDSVDRYSAEGAACSIAGFLSREHARRRSNPSVYANLKRHQEIVGHNYWFEYLVQLCWYVHKLGCEIHVRQISDKDLETDDEGRLTEIVSSIDIYRQAKHDRMLSLAPFFYFISSVGLLALAVLFVLVK